MDFLSFNVLKYSHRLKPHLGEASWVVVAQGLNVVGALVSVKVATTLLGPADYGRLATALAVAGLLQLCLYGAISQTATRFLFLANIRGSLDLYFRALGILGGFAVAIVVAVWGLSYVLGLSDLLLVSNWMIFLFLVASGTQQVLVAILNAGRARKAVALVQALDAFGRPLIILLASLWIKPSPTIVLGAYTISSALVVLVLLVALLNLRERLSCSEPETPDSAEEAASETSLTRQMVAYSLPFVIFGVVGSLGSHGERLLLTAWMPWEQVGVYALMSQLATTPTILLTSLINQFYLPVIFHQDPKGEGEFGPSFKRYLLVSALGTAILAVLVLIAGPYLVRLVSTRDFLGHEHLLALLVVSAALFGMGQQLVLPGLRARRSFIYILPKIIHSAALLVAAVLLVPALGLAGMATASVFAATLYAASVLVANARGGVRI